ncbi:hypothetical protein [Sulfurimonas sp.]|uniref:hypothetical protein n=1 Tax=Sulfurimonas sp. TaxID=2022749 RepID=UPI0025F06C4B|nr:hypothetical protein [Sulfurimonas sp.]
MYKYLFLILIGIGFSSGAIEYSNGNFSFDANSAKNTIVGSFNKLVELAEKYDK